MEYHKTKEPEYIKQLLDHRRMGSTMLYINIEQAIFQNTPPDEFHKVARTTEEIKTLLEIAFEYILQKDGLAFSGSVSSMVGKALSAKIKHLSLITLTSLRGMMICLFFQ
jgi:hypothetical protein